MIWIVIDPVPEMETGASLLLRRLRQQRPDMTLVVSAPEAMAMAMPPRTIRIDPAEDTPASVDLLLKHWQPDLLVLMGTILPPVLIRRAYDANLRIVAIDARLGAQDEAAGFFRRREVGALLSRLSRISARDPESLATLIALGADPARAEVGGLLSEPLEPLHCSEAERVSITAVTRTRPVWMAAAVPSEEMSIVLAAHTQAAQHAHRMLLVLVPEESEDANALAAMLDTEGWVVGRRSVEGEPDDDTQIFLADDPNEYGLWYRIAPVSYMGGTLTGAGVQPRSPLEAAALGSAILHGPQTAPFTADYARLDEARAARPLTETGIADLGAAVADLMAPDRAAMFAHNAWAVTSGGVGAAEAVTRAILTEVDAANGQAA